MTWVELTVEVTRATAEAAAEALFACGSAGVEEEVSTQVWEAPAAPAAPCRLRAWFDEPERGAVAAALRPHLLPGATLVWRPLAPTDWEAAWRAAAPPIVVTPTLTIAPPWKAPPGALLIEPGQGFGTAHHPTTRLALRALEALAGPGGPPQEVLDVGCGSGILALAAARWGHRARGVDVDPVAVGEARANAALNALTAEFTAAPLGQDTEPADLLIANMHAELLLEVRPHLLRLTRRTLILSGILADREQRVRAAFEPEDLRLLRREEEQGWVTLAFARRRGRSAR